MQKLLLVVISVLILPLSATVSAQRASPPPKPKVVATPKPERRSVVDRLFGRRDKATPAPEAKPVEKPAAATPAPRSKTRSKPRTAKREEKPEPKEDETPAAAAETQPPAPAEKEAEPAETTPPEPKPAAEPKASAASKKSSKTPPAPKIDTTGMDDSTKYRTVKAAALEDAALQELQAKAENAVTDAEAHAASVAYNRALFRKVRDLEPSLANYVDRLEDAMMKRLNSEKKRN